MFILAFVTSITLFAKPGDARIIELKTEKIGEAVHWMPDRVEVTPGEKVKFVAKHELVGGFDFHGLTIAVLKVAEQVNRNTATETKDLIISKSLKPGEYPIGCQFHPKHVSATLVVKEKGQ